MNVRAYSPFIRSILNALFGYITRTIKTKAVWMFFIEARVTMEVEMRLRKAEVTQRGAQRVI